MHPTSRATWKRRPRNGTDGIILAITGQDAINFIQSYISSGKTGVKFALITTDAAAVIKVIKGQKIDFYGSASYDRRNKQFLADMKAAGFKKTPVGQEIVSYSAVMACRRGGQGPAARSTGRRSTPSCPR